MSTKRLGHPPLPARRERLWVLDPVVQGDNYRRAWILALVVFVLQLPLVGIDLARLGSGVLEVHIGYRYLFYLHVLFQVVLGALLACLHHFRRRDGATVTRKRNVVVIGGVVSVLAVSGAITLVDQLIHGQATVYLLGAVGTALAVYLPIAISVLAFGGVSAVVLALLHLVQPDLDVLAGHLINISLITAVAITANATLYRQAVRTVRHLRLINEQRQELDRLASEDELTGVANRRYGDRRIREELARYRRYDRPFSLCFGDLDHFKLVNDRFSHAVGDRVLQHIAEILQRSLRGVDVVVRYGGEEFVLLLPETLGSEAACVCEKLRACIAGYAWELVEPGLVVTMSFGVADCTEGDDVAAILQIADERLYRAKELGRNRVQAAGV